MKLGLRIFLGYFLIVGLTAWMSLSLVLDEVKPVVRQVSEATLVETAHALAAAVTPAVKRGDFSAGEIASALRDLPATRIDADIWQLHKTTLGLRIYITDADGIVRFDTAGEAEGRNFSRWNDVHLTLQGRYGVRSSRTDPDDEFSSVMYVAAPLRDGDRIIGVLTAALPNRATQPYIDQARNTLWRYGLALLIFSLLVGTGFTAWLILSLRKLSDYALSVSDNRQVQPPQFARGTELEKLTDAIEIMRTRLEGKAYVERYVHTLTHELKSPIAAIAAATELLHDTQMPAAQRERFLHSIGEQTERLDTLIRKLLELARLEQKRQPDNPQTIAIAQSLETLAAAVSPLLATRALTLQIQCPPTLQLEGEHFLIEQALRNLLDNAIAFATSGSVISVHAETLSGAADDKTAVSTGVRICVVNHGEAIPDYAQERIGERFYSLPRPDGQRGHGLGLSFVREVMALHGGRFSIGNHEDGVRACLEFPASRH